MWLCAVHAAAGPVGGSAAGPDDGSPGSCWSGRSPLHYRQGIVIIAITIKRANEIVVHAS